MAKVDPFMAPIPRKLLTDPELAPFFTYLSKFLHDMWVRTGAGVDAIEGSPQLAGNNTFSGTNSFPALYVNDIQVVFEQQAAVSDAAAATATSPSSPTSYTAHGSGATPVTSSSATDLDTTAAALQTLVSEMTGYQTQISALIIDVADIRTQLNSFLAKARTHGLIAT